MTTTPNEDRIGLALSGGGSRAIAYHLGCLRALKEANLLKSVEIISTVSGGSIIGAMYAYRECSFEQFEKDVRNLLREGLLWKIVGRTLHPKNLVRSIATSVTAGTAAKATQGISLIAKLAQSACETLDLMSGSRASRSDWSAALSPPFSRWWSRSDAFEEALSNRLFGDKKLKAPRRNDLDVVINATELKTGTAFRYGSKLTSAWRYGCVMDDCTVAEAVSASAAYPLFLPAFHRRYTFGDRESSKEEVVLTDGGVYDNLGSTCLEPDRNSKYTDHVYNPNSIVVCHAGMGQWPEKSRPYGWISRMPRSMLTTFRKNEDGQKGQVVRWGVQDTSPFRNSILTSLGQKDEKLHQDLGDNIPDDLVPREKVINYPTDFNAMPRKDINRIVRRGEQVTRLLVKSYWN